jgi:hypothetical protein
MAKKTRKPAVWNRALAYPIKLRDGDVISTMAQAARLMTQRLPKARQEKPVWQHTAELLMQAQKSGKAIEVRAATDQLCRALQLEGWM